MLALNMKRVSVEIQCPWCHSSPETDTHVLFKCEFARKVWFTSGVQQLIQTTVDSNAATILGKIFEVGTRE